MAILGCSCAFEPLPTVVKTKIVSITWTVFKYEGDGNANLKAANQMPHGLSKPEKADRSGGTFTVALPPLLGTSLWFTPTDVDNNDGKTAAAKETTRAAAAPPEGEGSEDDEIAAQIEALAAKGWQVSFKPSPENGGLSQQQQLHILRQWERGAVENEMFADWADSRPEARAAFNKANRTHFYYPSTVTRRQRSSTRRILSRPSWLHSRVPGAPGSVVVSDGLIFLRRQVVQELHRLDIGEPVLFDGTCDQSPP